MTTVDCSEALARLWEYIDGALGPDEAEAFRAHLDRCFGCGAAERFDRAFLALLARQRQCRAPAELVVRLRRLLHE
jgi:anti-sigma factor (TIGR02949 family)